MRGAPVARTTLRVAAAYAAALLLPWLVARLGLQPASILVAGSAALVVACLFAIRPAEGLGAYLLFSLLADTWQYRFAIDVRYFDEIGLILLVAVALVRYRIPARRLRVGVPEVALAALLASGIAASLVNQVPLGVWIPGLLLFMKGLVLLYLVSWLPLRLPDVTRVGVVVLGGGALLLVIGLVEFAHARAVQQALGLPPYLDQRGGLTVIKSLFLHPGVFGWLMVFASLFAFAYFLVYRRWWVLGFAVAFDLAAILSGRRTPVVGQALALLVGLAWYWSRGPAERATRSWMTVLGGAALLTAIFVPVAGGMVRDVITEYVDSAHTAGQILGEHPDPSRIAKVAPRTALYVASVAIARDHLPLGAGFGRFGSYMSRQQYSPLYREYGLERIYGLSPQSRIAIDDTYWPSVLGETGPIGLAAMLVVMGAIGLRVWRLARIKGPDGWTVFALGTGLIFVQALVASLTAATFVAAPIALFVFGTIGALYAVAATEGLESGEPIASSGPVASG